MLFHLDEDTTINLQYVALVEKEETIIFITMSYGGVVTYEFESQEECKELYDLILKNLRVNVTAEGS